MTVDRKIVDAYVEKKLSEMQIAKLLAIAPSRVRRVLNTQKIARRSRSDAIRYLNITKFHKKPCVIKRQLSKKEQLLKIAGVMLYWGEGSKKGNTVAFSNSDRVMIRVFLSFLRDVCGIDENRLRVVVHYYADHDIKKLLRFWSTETNIPMVQFYKPFLHPATKRGSYKQKSQYGTISIQYSDKQLLQQILSWIHEYGHTLS